MADDTQRLITAYEGNTAHLEREVKCMDGLHRLRWSIGGKRLSASFDEAAN